MTRAFSTEGPKHDDGRSGNPTEFSAPNRGTWSLTCLGSDEGYRSGARVEYLLSLYEHRSSTRRNATFAGAALGLLVFGGACIAALPIRGAPDGLTLTRADAWWCAFAVGGSVGAALGGWLAWALIGVLLSRTDRKPSVPGLKIQFGDHVHIDGTDAGRLLRIESHPASAILLVMAEHDEARVELANERDAAGLARALDQISVERHGAGEG